MPTKKSSDGKAKAAKRSPTATGKAKKSAPAPKADGQMKIPAAVDLVAWEQIKATHKRAHEYEAKVEDAQVSLKALRKQRDGARKELDELIEDANGGQMRLPLAVEIKADGSAMANGLKKAGEAVGEFRNTLEPWRSVLLADLEPKIKPAKLKILAEHEPRLETMGDLADWQKLKGDFWAKDIKGLGDGGIEQIVKATDAYWAKNPPQAEKKADDPSEELKAERGRYLDIAAKKIVDAGGEPSARKTDKAALSAYIFEVSEADYDSLQKTFESGSVAQMKLWCHALDKLTKDQVVNIIRSHGLSDGAAAEQPEAAASE